MVAMIEVVREDQLDFVKLITYLSKHEGFPCSLHIRNHLLASYAAHVPCPSLRGRSHDDAPWRTYQQYRPGAQMAAIGQVPHSILANARSVSGREQGLWALVIVYPVYAPGWVAKQATGKSIAHLYTNTSFTIWMSSETKHAGSLEEMREANDEEIHILRFVQEEFLPSAATRVELEATGAVPDKTVDTNIFAVNDIWIRALAKLAQSSSSTDFVITRTNSCRTFVLPDHLALELQKRDISQRWSIELIEEGDIDFVQSSNSLSFPLWYVRHHIHRSVLLRDRQGDDFVSNKAAYPTSQARDAPAGWAYGHDTMSIGSLHVAEPYRRHREPDTRYGSVGQACICALARVLIEAQQYALTMAGCDAGLPAPIQADTELQKGVALSFFVKNGFESVSISTWGEVKIRTIDQRDW